jgi:S-DNA-T family DNA segregation ATPase FtsK/SpoIIIE
MFFFKKKKYVVTERTEDSKPFEIPQIISVQTTESKLKIQDFVSPVFGRKKDVDVVKPSSQTLSQEDIDIKYDDFRVKPKLTKEEKIKRYGTAYPEFTRLEGTSPDNMQIISGFKNNRSEEPAPEPNIAENTPVVESDEQPKEEIKAPSTNDEPVKEETLNEPKADPFEGFEEETQPGDFNQGGSQYKQPPIDLLDLPKRKETDSLEDIETKTKIINDVLESFSVAGHVVAYTKGPTVTRFEILLDRGVSVNKVTNIEKNIKMVLAAKDIRIEAPIPGKTTIGIEVPNHKPDLVTLYEILSSDTIKQTTKDLKIGIGLDIDGNVIHTSIVDMPHGLVAGATGSGKSVFINVMLLNLLYFNSPEDLRILLIDPKQVDLQLYADLPHLITPVIRDDKIATAALKWLVDEMDQRFELFFNESVKHITTYNEKMMERGEKKMPYIVTVIDELSDLMAVSSNAVEQHIMRLTQKARACGIHLIVATQRPSSDVIKGTIKANIPTRIAFQVSGYIDSQTILDSKGAETLIGNGDMLLAEAGKQPIRVQSAFVSEQEIEFVTNFIRSQQKPDYFFTEDELIEKVVVSESQDEILAEVASYVVRNQAASMNRISKEFNIGFNRAQAIMEQLESLGIVGTNQGQKARDILVTEDELDHIFGGKK